MKRKAPVASWLCVQFNLLGWKSFLTGPLVPDTDGLFVFPAIHLLILVGRDWMLAGFQRVTHASCLLGIKP